MILRKETRRKESVRNFLYAQKVDGGRKVKGIQNYVKEILGKINRIHDLREKSHCSYTGLKSKRRSMFDGSGRSLL